VRFVTSRNPSLIGEPHRLCVALALITVGQRSRGKKPLSGDFLRGANQVPPFG
jgi:hypothetical protein